MNRRTLLLMAGTIKVRVREMAGQIMVKAVIKHSIRTGKCKIKKTGKKIATHYIHEVLVSRTGSVGVPVC